MSSQVIFIFPPSSFLPVWEQTYFSSVLSIVMLQGKGDPMPRATRQIGVAIAGLCLASALLAKEAPPTQWTNGTATVHLGALPRARDGRVSAGIDKTPFQDRARVAHVEFVDVAAEDLPKVSAFLEGRAQRSYR